MSERRGTRGILNPVAGLQRFRLNRFEPCAALAPFVDWYWVVRWDLPEEAAPFEQEVLPHPCVNLAIEARGSAIHGVFTRRTVAKLSGRGRVASGASVGWARLALELGYHDQAHLIRDFKSQIGFTPGQYAKRCAEAARAKAIGSSR